MKHLSTFEGWRDSEKLNKLNRLTGIFDNGPICEIENGDDYGMRDDVVKAHYIKREDGTTVHFEKIEGMMDDSINRLEFFMSDGKRITIDSYFHVGAPMNASSKKEYFEVECNNQIVRIDPEFALEEIIANFGDGAHLFFVMLFYPNCEMYYKDEKVNMPAFKKV